MPIQLSRYKILEDLGKGCLGSTHVAEPVGHPGQKRVLTLVSDHFVQSPAFVNQLTQMAHISSHLQVEGYMPLLEVSKDGNTLVATRDYAAGKSLRQWFSKALNFEQRMDEGLRYLGSLGEILTELHHLGFYGHLKPENILVGNDGLWITDNWILPLLPATEFKRNTQAVTYLPYFAPEVRRDWTALSEKADYYSLGALLHEVLLGKPPAAISLVPSQKSKRYDKEVDNILLRFLNKDPNARHADLNSWLDTMTRLRQILLGSPKSDDSLVEELETGTKARYSDGPKPGRSLEPQAVMDDDPESEEDLTAVTAEAFPGNAEDRPETEAGSGNRQGVPEPTPLDGEMIEEVETRVQYFSGDSEKETTAESRAKAKREVAGLDDNLEPFRKKTPHVRKTQPQKTAPLWAKLLLAVVGLGLVGGSVFLGIMASTLWK